MIRGLLKTDPQLRFLVEDVMNNPWIKVTTHFMIKRDSYIKKD